jgi:hypothetical protein
MYYLNLVNRCNLTVEKGLVDGGPHPLEPNMMLKIADVQVWMFRFCC